MDEVGLGYTFALPANPKSLPGLPGGKAFNWDSLPVVPDGPAPTSGIKAVDKIIPAGVTHYLSVLEAPRKQNDRIPPDEFSLMVLTYNKAHGTALPSDPMHHLWKTAGWWDVREAIARIATGRWNAFMCRTGRGHCPQPDILEQIGNAISKIPIVGDVVHIVGEAAAAPFKFVADIASGARLDKALMGALKDQVQIVKDVAPYAQTVVSLVPGIGTGVAAAIGAGAALAEGKSIDEAAKAAIKGALPGGPLAAAAFDTAVKVAGGANVAKSALEGARNLVPDGPARKAFDIGTAVATGEKLQNALVQGLTSLAPAQLQSIVAAGQSALKNTPGLSDAIKLLPAGEAQQGFQLAAGLLSHSGLSQKAVSAVRAKISPASQKGFDAAMATQAKYSPHLVVTQQLKDSVAALYKQAAEDAKAKPAEPKAAPHVPEPPKKAAAAPKVPEPAKAAPKPLEPPQRAAAPAAPAATPAAPTGERWGPYPPAGALSAPTPIPHLRPYLPHHQFQHAPHPHGGPRTWPGWRGGWNIPYNPDVVYSTTETCRTWGNPVDLPPPMQQAARAALGASQGRPTTVRGPDGVLYLFAFENGALTARPCAAVAIS